MSGCAEHRHRGDRAGEHADLEAKVLGDAGRDGIKHRARMDATLAGEKGAELLALWCPVHGVDIFLPRR